MDKRTDEKKSRLLSSLEEGMAMVHLDARHPGVLVPEHLRQPYLALNLSYKFDPPDLAVSDWGVRSTLSFSGKRFTVGLPWSAIYGIFSHASGELWMYPDDIPKELLGSTGPFAGAATPAPPRRLAHTAVPEPSQGEQEVPPAADAPRLDVEVQRQKVLEALEQAASAPVEPPKQPEPRASAPRPSTPRRGHLRLVK